MTIYSSIYVAVNTQCRCTVGEVSPLLFLSLPEEKRGAKKFCVYYTVYREVLEGGELVYEWRREKGIEDEGAGRR